MKPPHDPEDREPAEPARSVEATPLEAAAALEAASANGAEASAAPRPLTATPGPRDLLEALKHQEVVVWANAITYRGTLLGADDEEIYLKTSLRYVTVRMDRISKIAAASEAARLDPLKHVDATFYRVSDDDPPDAG